MVDPTRDAKPTARADQGAASVVSGQGHVTQTVNVAPPGAGKTATVIVPILAAVISAVGGAYANHRLSLARAPVKTDAQAETLLGIARGAIELAQSTKADPTLVAKLRELASQSQSVQANLQLLRTPPGAASLQADFWLPVNKGATLGGSTAFGIHRENGPGNIGVIFNGGATTMLAGTPLKYKAKDGKACTLIYVGPAPDGKVHGFKTVCEGQ